MSYNGEQYKWFCNECDNTWFSDLPSEDLCNYTLCESEHIYRKEIKKKDLKKYKELKTMLKSSKEKIVYAKRELKDLSWVN